MAFSVLQSVLDSDPGAMRLSLAHTDLRDVTGLLPLLAELRCLR